MGACAARVGTAGPPARALPAPGAFRGDAGVARPALTANRPKRSEAAVVGVGFLDRFAIVDASRRRERGSGEEERRGEEHGAKNARVIARSVATRQSRDGLNALNCFASLAMTACCEIMVSHPRSVAPHFFSASATIFCATASISASVSVFSRGCRVTARPIDFLSSGTPLPS